MIENSISCEQSIKHTCTVNVLSEYASWIGSDGISHNYWHGSGNDTNGCQCSLDGSCIKNPFGNSVCNCDSGRVNMIDDGILTNKKSLPVKALRYGAFTPLSSINYSLGPLKCEGKRAMYPSERKEFEKRQLSVKIEKLFSSLIDVDTKMQQNARKSEEQSNVISESFQSDINEISSDVLSMKSEMNRMKAFSTKMNTSLIQMESKIYQGTQKSGIKIDLVSEKLKSDIDQISTQILNVEQQVNDHNLTLQKNENKFIAFRVTAIKDIESGTEVKIDQNPGKCFNIVQL